jgi:hypothetical protein
MERFAMFFTMRSIWAALAALSVAPLAAQTVRSADLGGSCCADLEERIAELEATAARKGNRKVSLTVSGWVTQQITWWDDGFESNAYVHDLGTTLGSHVKFSGQAQFAPGWNAGYVLHLESISNDGLIGTDQDNATGGAAVRTLQSYWFIKSDSIGKISVGQQSQASDNAAILIDNSGTLVAANWVSFDQNHFFVRTTQGDMPFRWDVGSCGNMGGSWGDCNGVPRNVVRYDTPSLMGFSASASWGEDDMWDVAARFQAERSGFKVAAVVAYNEVSDEGFSGTGAAGDEGRYLQAGVYMEHIDTGLFILENYGRLTSAEFDGTSETFYIKGGLRRRFSHLGATVFYGEYLNNQTDGVFALSTGVGSTNGILNVWGLGAVQEIDAAAMSTWIKYRNSDYEDNSGLAYEKFKYVGMGGIVNF